MDLYKKAGVDVEKGDRLVTWLQGDKSPAANEYGSVVSGIGGFAALFRPNFKGLADPLLIASTDGVGTKVLLGSEHGLTTGLGIDLVAMCVNDLYTVGGRPLFFLDYYATGALDETQFKDVLTGIKDGCRQSGALLMGGETAEMPGLYAKGHFDLAGFVVGVVDGKALLGPAHVKVGDRLYSLPSSGFHSNGYSLLRKWLAERPVARGVLEKIIAPTKIYHEIPALVAELGTGKFHALANITGGGISGNLPRVLPDDTKAVITKSALRIPPWMRDYIESNLAGGDALSQEGVFNLGCGMIAAVSADAGAALEKAGLGAHQIGEIKPGRGEATVEFT